MSPNISFLVLIICRIWSYINIAGAVVNLTSKPNFLIMIADDMSPVVDPYIPSNHPLHGKTPNIKELAENGQTFLFATSQQSICGPSRAALLTGRYPETLQIYNNQQYLQEVSEDLQTIPRYFKEQHNYYTAAFGKVFHPHILLGRDIYYERGHLSQETKGYFSDGNHECRSSRNHMYCSIPNKYADKLSDAKVVKYVESFLKERTKHDQPWLALIGFRRPHLTNAAPASSYSEISMDDVRYFPFLKNTPVIEGDGSSFREKLAHYECRRIGNKYIKKANKGRSGFIGDIETLLNRTEAVSLIRQGYYAAIHFLDVQVGKIINALGKNGYKDNTVVIFTSDHGYQNGERNMWCKSTLYHTAAGVPLIISIPGLPQEAISRSPTQLVDLLPTMIELLGEDPAVQLLQTDQTILRLDGVSMLPVILNTTKIHHAAMFSQYPRCVCDQRLLDENLCPSASDYTKNDFVYEPKTVQFHSCVEAFSNSVQMDDNYCSRPAIVYMGFSIRTGKWKYIEFRHFHEEQTKCETPSIEGFDFPSGPAPHPDESPIGGIECQRMGFSRSETFTFWNEEPIQRELYDVENISFFGQIDEESSNLLAPGTGGVMHYEQVANDLSRMIKLKYTDSEPICNNHGVLKKNKCQCVDNWDNGKKCKNIAPGMERHEHSIDDWHVFLGNAPTQMPISCDTYSCPEHSHSIPGQECITKLKHCECDFGYKLNKKSEECLPCNTFTCPMDSKPKAGINCVKKFSHCECNSGFKEEKKMEKCVSCNTYSCPEHSYTKPGVQCTKKFNHCKCERNFKPKKDTEQCVPCDNLFICPSHSTPKEVQCITSFSDCKCDPGYKKKYNECVPS